MPKVSFAFQYIQSVQLEKLIDTKYYTGHIYEEHIDRCTCAHLLRSYGGIHVLKKLCQSAPDSAL